MASITIRNLDDDVKDLLRQLAAENGCSMEEQARLMIRAAVEGRAGQADRIEQIEQTLRALAGSDQQATAAVAASGKTRASHVRDDRQRNARGSFPHASRAGHRQPADAGGYCAALRSQL